MKTLFSLLLVFVVGFAAAQGDYPDQSLFETLFSNIADVVSPAWEGGSPAEVFLMETPGFSINPADYETEIWRANGMNSPYPAANTARLVDRMPLYLGPTFVDSGTTLSQIWGNFMRQYLVPIETDKNRIKAARRAWENLKDGSLEEEFEAALEVYDVALGNYFELRKECLQTNYPNEPGVCARLATVWTLRLRRKWFSMEVSRRAIASAEAEVLALQLTDLKTLFADALERFESNRRIDVGADTFGNPYYVTLLEPSNFYRWWPKSLVHYDYMVSSLYDASTGAVETINLAPPDGGMFANPADAISTNPLLGSAEYVSSSIITYTPNIGEDGVDRIQLKWCGTGVACNASAAVNTTGISEVTYFIGVNGLGAPDESAWTEVGVSKSSSTTSTESRYTRMGYSVEASGRYGIVKASASVSGSTASSSSSFSASGSSFTMSFQVAKVLIRRPWLDTSILTFSPVGISGLKRGDWSDGTGLPPSADAGFNFKFPLLPTSMILARDVSLETTFTSETQQAAMQSSMIDVAASVSVGPFFSGSGSFSRATGSSTASGTSDFVGNTLTIVGPQIIGWNCTPLPVWPTADDTNPAFTAEYPDVDE